MDQHQFTTRNFLIIFLLYLVLFLTDLTLPLKPLRNAIERVLNPLQQGLYISGIKTYRYFQFIGSFGQLLDENSTLRVQLIDLYALQIENERVKEENKLLREELDSLLVQIPQFTVTRVLGISISGQNMLLVVDIGSQQGVQEGMIAYYREALVGRVLRVSGSRSYILPLVATDSKIPVYVDLGEKGRVDGLLTGEFNTKALLTQIVGGTALTTESLIYTSGIGDIFPQGIFVGKVGELQTGINEVFLEAEVKVPWVMSDIQTLFLTQGIESL